MYTLASETASEFLSSWKSGMIYYDDVSEKWYSGSPVNIAIQLGLSKDLDFISDLTYNYKRHMKYAMGKILESYLVSITQEDLSQWDLELDSVENCE